MFSPFNITPRYWVGKSLLFFPVVPERHRQVGVTHVDCPGHGTLSRLTPPSLMSKKERIAIPSKASNPRCSGRKLPEKEASALPYSTAGQIRSARRSQRGWPWPGTPLSTKHLEAGPSPSTDLTQAEASRACPSGHMEAVPWPHSSGHIASCGRQNSKGNQSLRRAAVTLQVPIAMILPKCYLETISQFKSIVPIDLGN